MVPWMCAIFHMMFARETVQCFAQYSFTCRASAFALLISFIYSLGGMVSYERRAHFAAFVIAFFHNAISAFPLLSMYFAHTWADTPYHAFMKVFSLHKSALTTLHGSVCSIPWYYADFLGALGLFLAAHHMVRSKHPEQEYVVKFLIQTYINVVTVLAVVTESETMQNIHVMNEFAYYTAFTLLEKDHGMIAHHMLTILAIMVAYNYHDRDILAMTLLVFNPSTPFLTLAKYGRMVGYTALAQASFIIFASLFFICRICIIPIILKKYLWGWNASTHAYITLNALLSSLYGMQLWWLTKIVRIIKTKILCVPLSDGGSHGARAITREGEARTCQGSGGDDTSPKDA